MTADVIPFGTFLAAREKKLDPKGYAGRKIVAAIDRQVKAAEAAKPLLIGETPSLDDGFDDAPVFDKTLCWGVAGEHYERQRLLNKYLTEQAQSDPGDEI
jgi:hypothetical protein